ncbi:sugar kinase [Sphaerisporangium krabiense]|uniref:Sugar/nucleoside kinase (Ribokinase family) n=1 Tax=Sphaerisporangium krabiense TaxID=763782 RepID=A0A7W8ZAS5_9ACTN|nr:PfkB family carbohydrate kinase [Sphaerisporangium krabiense]MBB5630629.1 sugar/nucleoside kinase (ribokinase family) [Sphaerisporangium krabiense]GII62414.1 sugar kinase [Sphaerisporangium krabiense]
MGGLLVIGDAVTDVVAVHGAPVATGTDTPADIVVRPGGSGANTACWAAHLGADARLLTRVGYDTGAWHVAELRGAGVRPHARVDPGHPTAVVIAMVDGAGERSMLTNRGAGGRIGPSDWDDRLLDGVSRLHVSAYTLFAGPGLDLFRTAVRAAARRGVAISVDPASTGPLAGFGVDRFLRETAAASLLVPNRDEALLLTGERDPEAAAAALGARYGMAAVKLGAGGALLARDGRVVARAPAVAARAVDSTGAGDAFAAGFLAALLSGHPAESALVAGCAAGARAVARLGGRPVPAGGMPAVRISESGEPLCSP